MSKVELTVTEQQINKLLSEAASTITSDWLHYVQGTAAQKEERLTAARIAYTYLLKGLEELYVDDDLDPQLRADLYTLFFELKYFSLQRNLAFTGFYLAPSFDALIVGLLSRLARFDIPIIMYEVTVQLLFYFNAFPKAIRVHPFPIAPSQDILSFLVQLLANQIQELEAQPELADFQNSAQLLFQALQISDDAMIKVHGLELYKQLQQLLTDRGDVLEEIEGYIIYDLVELTKILIHEAAESILDYYSDEDEADDIFEDEFGDDDGEENSREIGIETADDDLPMIRAVFGFDEQSHQYYLQTADGTIFIEPARPEDKPLIAKAYALFSEYYLSLNESDVDEDDEHQELLEKYRELFFFLGSFAPLELLSVYRLMMEELLGFNQEEFIEGSVAALLTTLSEILEALLEKGDFETCPNLEPQLWQLIWVLQEFLADDPDLFDEEEFDLQTNRLIDLIGLVEEAAVVYEKAD